MTDAADRSSDPGPRISFGGAAAGRDSLYDGRDSHFLPADSILSVRGLTVTFDVGEGPRPAIEDVSFDVPRGGCLAIVGETGSGKSVTAHAILGLIEEPAGHIRSGRVLYGGQDLLQLPDSELRAIRGAKIAMVFQEPMTSLNPVYKIGAQIAEALEVHGIARGKQARARAIEALRRVGFPQPERHADDYPHQLSGGMRQRVMIAMALVCKPDLIIADEPTTALDSVVQAQILGVLADARRELGMSLLLVSHDLDVVSSVADDLVVLYAGRVVERGNVHDILREPHHPYTRGLLASVPRRSEYRVRGRVTRPLPTLRGSPPMSIGTWIGCRFRDRCPDAFDRCAHEEPALIVLGGRAARCFLADAPTPLSTIRGAPHRHASDPGSDPLARRSDPDSGEGDRPTHAFDLLPASIVHPSARGMPPTIRMSDPFDLVDRKVPDRMAVLDLAPTSARPPPSDPAPAEAPPSADAAPPDEPGDPPDSERT